MKRNDELDKTFFESLTDLQKDEISKLDGIGRETHYFGGVQLANVIKNGENIGWSTGAYNGVGVCQTKTDFKNWTKIIDYFRPEMFFEFGVARGGNLLYIYDLIKKHHPNPLVIGFDINDDRDDFSKKNDKVNFYISNSISKETENIVKNILDSNSKRCMIYLDDNHDHLHVLKELEIYSKILKSGDIIIIGDTWDEGWYNSPYQGMKIFLNNNTDFYFEKNIHKEMEMPCNWIFGILIKK